MRTAADASNENKMASIVGNFAENATEKMPRSKTSPLCARHPVVPLSGSPGGLVEQPIMPDADVYRAILEARRAWNDYLDATDEEEDEVYEAYLEAASEAVPLVGGLLELCVEANLVAISARDREERYVDLAATNARVHADAIIEIVGDIVLGHSEDLPEFERRTQQLDDADTRFNRAREMFRDMNRPNVSRAVDELRQLRDELLRSGQENYAGRLSHVLALLQISPPRLSD
jgi:hypothetical protein